jgi:hypothetical protein
MIHLIQPMIARLKSLENEIRQLRELLERFCPPEDPRNTPDPYRER